MDYSDREEVKNWFEQNGDTGWHTLIDIVYDNKPEQIAIIEVFEKYAALEIRYLGENEDYKDLIGCIHTVSQRMCQVCGKSGSHSLIDGWETTLCDEHFESSPVKNKLRG
ncbi:MAG: hypothetical protein ACO1N0_10185 [Fluviicola sp.]